MLVLDKVGDEIRILLRPDEEVRVGDILYIEGMVTQVVDIEYANVPGLIEHFLRKSLISGYLENENVDEEVKGFLDVLADHRVAVTKIRGIYKDGIYTPGLSEFNVNRSEASIEFVEYPLLEKILGLESRHKSKIGLVKLGNKEFEYGVLLDKLGINLITGMKGTGKSYLAKKLLLKLLNRGKIVIVFDINGEYVNLWKKPDGSPNEYFDRIKILDPQASREKKPTLPLKIPLDKISSDDFASFMNVGPNTQMYDVLMAFWYEDQPKNLNHLESLIKKAYTNGELNRLAYQGLMSRIKTARVLNLFGPFDLISILNNFKNTGGALIVNLKRVNRRQREVLVDFILRQLVTLRKEKKINPLVLYAEEAQLYVTKDMWDDLLTRVRHYGIFPTFITNDPRTLPDEVFSLCDNIFSFAFQNQDDLRAIGKAKMIDEATLKIIRNLEPRHCLIIGSVTKDFPIVIKVTEEHDIEFGGETERLF